MKLIFCYKVTFIYFYQLNVGLLTQSEINTFKINEQFFQTRPAQMKFYCFNIILFTCNLFIQF